MKNSNEIQLLQQKLSDHQQKIVDLNNWLMRNHDHPDRSKVWSDKAYHERERSVVERMIKNVEVGIPALGFPPEISVPFDSKTQNKI